MNSPEVFFIIVDTCASAFVGTIGILFLLLLLWILIMATLGVLEEFVHGLIHVLGWRKKR